MASGQYTFLQMIEVLNLVAFSVTIAAQMLTFSKSYFHQNISNLF